MTGGLMQLVCYGSQDIYITGNPQFTYFKNVYRRHTNFSFEVIEQSYSGDAKMGSTFSCTISRSADLLSGIMMEIDLSIYSDLTINNITINNGVQNYAGELTAGTNNNQYNYDKNAGTIEIKDNEGNIANVSVNNELLNVHNNFISLINSEKGLYRLGLRMIKLIEFEIGGQVIDRHYGEWMDIWSHISYGPEKWHKWNRMVNASIDSISNPNCKKVYIPLLFWFCRNPGLALPLIALQYHEVKLKVTFRDEIVNTNAYNFTEITKNLDNNNIVIDANLTDANTNNFPKNSTVSLTGSLKQYINIEECIVFGEYIFVDTDERRRFSGVTHEYLIEQLQMTNNYPVKAFVNQIGLNFNHPIKEIFWTIQTNDNKEQNFNYYNSNDGDLFKKGFIEMNKIIRFSSRVGNYFRHIQPYQHHNGSIIHDPSEELGGYYSYSFSLIPEELQPSGTCNFSRIDKAIFIFEASEAGTIKFYAINYNVLKIMSGMGALVYSN